MPRIGPDQRLLSIHVNDQSLHTGLHVGHILNPYKDFYELVPGSDRRMRDRGAKFDAWNCMSGFDAFLPYEDVDGSSGSSDKSDNFDKMPRLLQAAEVRGKAVPLRHVR